MVLWRASRWRVIYVSARVVIYGWSALEAHPHWLLVDFSAEGVSRYSSSFSSSTISKYVWREPFNKKKCVSLPLLAKDPCLFLQKKVSCWILASHSKKEHIWLYWTRPGAVPSAITPVWSGLTTRKQKAFLCASDFTLFLLKKCNGNTLSYVLSFLWEWFIHVSNLQKKRINNKMQP